MPIYKIFNGKSAEMLAAEKQIITKLYKQQRNSKRALTVINKNRDIIQNIYNNFLTLNDDKNAIDQYVDYIINNDETKNLYNNFNRLYNLIDDNIYELLNIYEDLYSYYNTEYGIAKMDITNHKSNINIITNKNGINLYEYENSVNRIKTAYQQLLITIDKLKSIINSYNDHIYDDIIDIKFYDDYNMEIDEIILTNYRHLTDNTAKIDVNIIKNDGTTDTVSQLLFENGDNANGCIHCNKTYGGKFIIYINKLKNYTDKTNIFTYETYLYAKEYPSKKLHISIVIDNTTDNSYIGIN